MQQSYLRQNNVGRDWINQMCMSFINTIDNKIEIYFCLHYESDGIEVFSICFFLFLLYPLFSVVRNFLNGICFSFEFSTEYEYDYIPALNWTDQTILDGKNACIRFFSVLFSSNIILTKEMKSKRNEAMGKKVAIFIYIS